MIKRSIKKTLSHGTLLVLEPLRQTNADLENANEVLYLIHEMVLAYCSPFLMAIIITIITIIIDIIIINIIIVITISFLSIIKATYPCFLVHR